MFYLKCDSCGHPNEVKSEFLTFCTRCGKKLDNNFKAWNVENPTKRFEDYLKEVCIDPENTPLQNQEINTFSVKRLVLRIVAAVAGFLILMVVILFGKDWISKIFDKPLDTLVDKVWIMQSYGNSGLNIEVPIKLKKTNKIAKKTAPEIKKYIEHASSFEGGFGNNLQIVVNEILFVEGVETSLRGAANGAISEIKSQKGVRNFAFTESQFQPSGIPGVLQLGGYFRQGKQYRFYNAVFAKDQHTWQVLVVFNAMEKSGERIATRVINSIFISTAI